MVFPNSSVGCWAVGSCLEYVLVSSRPALVFSKRSFNHAVQIATDSQVTIRIKKRRAETTSWLQGYWLNKGRGFPRHTQFRQATECDSRVRIGVINSYTDVIYTHKFHRFSASVTVMYASFCFSNGMHFVRVAVISWTLSFSVHLSGLLLFVSDADGKTLGLNVTNTNYSRHKSQLVKSVKKINETERVLILICGFILGVPLTVLAGCGVRAFALSMWEDYKIKAIRRNYLYRMRVASGESSPRWPTDEQDVVP